jgi:hypothetical protein
MLNSLPLRNEHTYYSRWRRQNRDDPSAVRCAGWETPQGAYVYHDGH